MILKAGTNVNVSCSSFFVRPGWGFKASLSGSLRKFLGSGINCTVFRNKCGKNVTCIAEKLHGVTSRQLNSRDLKYKYVFFFPLLFSGIVVSKLIYFEKSPESAYYLLQAGNVESEWRSPGRVSAIRN